MITEAVGIVRHARVLAVPHLDQKIFVCDFKTHVHFAGVGEPHGIGNALLDNAVRGGLHRPIQPIVETCLAEIHRHLILFSIVLAVPLQRGQQAKIVQQTGTQIYRKRTNVLHQVRQQSLGAAQLFFALVLVQSRQGGDGKFDSSQHLPDLFVEFVRQMPALRFLKLDQTLRQVLEFLIAPLGGVIQNLFAKQQSVFFFCLLAVVDVAKKTHRPSSVG